MIQPEGGEATPLPSKEPKIDRTWTDGGRDWLWGNRPRGRRKWRDEDFLDDW